MKYKLALFCTVSVFISLSQAKRWNTNKDSIIVDAQYNGDDFDTQRADDAVEKAECHTSDGEPGECVTVIRCHPILFSEKGQLRNSGLALTYAQTEDVCVTRNTLDGSAEGGKDSQGDSKIGQKVICCAKDRIQYDLRSDASEDFETYTTTESSQVDPIAVTTVPQVFDEVLQTTQNTVVTDDEVVLVSENSDVKPHVPVIVFDVEAVTTQKPNVVEEPQAEPEAEPEPVIDSEQSQIVEAVSVTNQPEESVPTSEPVPQVPDAGQGVPEPEPELVPAEEVLEQKPPSSACPSTASYRTWPVFEDYPWLATIQTRAKTGPTCSGSLITESHVMTAAHCLHRFNSRDVARMHIRIGFTKRSNNDTFDDYYVERNASKIIFHKRFHEQSKMDNNIALIKLDEPVEFDDHIAPIGVFNGIGGFDVGNCSAVEAGWIKFGNRKVTGISQGVIHFIEAPMSNFHLRESLSRVLNNEECGEQLNSQINEKMICARSKLFEEPSVSTDFFRWNDGGPLVVKVGNMIQQVGIKSWAYEGQQYPTVYTRVDTYLDWIRNNLKM